jgi:hypothetical protein
MVQNAIWWNSNISGNEFMWSDPEYYFRSIASGNAANVVPGIRAYSTPVDVDDLRTGDFAFCGNRHIGLVIMPFDIETNGFSNFSSNITYNKESIAFSRNETYILHLSGSSGDRIQGPRVVVQPYSKIDGITAFGRDPNLTDQDP